MNKKSKQATEYGDFQTPPELAQAVCDLLEKQGQQPLGLVEPTCGLGSLLFAALERFNGLKSAVGADINVGHVDQARETLCNHVRPERVKLVEADFFVTDWGKVIAELPEPVLVLGNLPWVTNAQLGSLGSQNLPTKSNSQNHAGLDAVTGKANFDISEWMMSRLVEAMNGRDATLAMLCKSSVARKILCHVWKKGFAVRDAAIYQVDALRHFRASVDAVLLVIEFGFVLGGAVQANVFSGLAASNKSAVIGYEDDTLLADLRAYRRWKHLNVFRKSNAFRWRSGVKHDCSKVMELDRCGDCYRNGLGEVVEIEDTYVYPMLKSSGVAGGGNSDRLRYMIVPQRAVNEDTMPIRDKAPLTWAYLTSHAEFLNRRGSSVYRDRPPFSVFGVGDYAFAPWKVAISGFYKKLAFAALPPAEGRPIMLDDTSYFLPCDNEGQAQCLASLVNSDVAQSFYRAFIFWDNKRPITADLLGRLDLRAVARELGTEAEFDAHFTFEFTGGSESRSDVAAETKPCVVRGAL
jgi:hypothetical protein